jgi:hypothetical protein
MEESMVAFAAERDFEALDLMIRRYHTHCNDLDDKPPEDKNDLYLSRVGNRWALKADLDALSGAILKQAIDAATDKPDPDDPARSRNATPPPQCAWAAPSSTAVKARPKTANAPTSRSPSRSKRCVPARSRRPAIWR